MRKVPLFVALLLSLLLFSTILFGERANESLFSTLASVSESRESGAINDHGSQSIMTLTDNRLVDQDVTPDRFTGAVTTRLSVDLPRIVARRKRVHNVARHDEHGENMVLFRNTATTAPPAWCADSALHCLSGQPHGVIAGDFNGDGRTDFLSANGNFDVWLANADGPVTENTQPASSSASTATNHPLLGTETTTTQVVH